MLTENPRKHHRQCQTEPLSPSIIFWGIYGSPIASEVWLNLARRKATSQQQILSRSSSSFLTAGKRKPLAWLVVLHRKGLGFQVEIYLDETSGGAFARCR